LTYQYSCPACGRVELDFPVKEYPGSHIWWPCPKCIHAYVHRVFTVPFFQEDRRHHGGEHFSKSLGRVAPQSRSEAKLLEKQGVVFDSFKHPVSSEGVAARDYQRAVEAGATPEQAEAAAPWPQPPPRQIDVEGWKKRRYESGKPLDRVTESEMTQDLANAGFKPDF
jgi:hypothetical protein